MTIFAIDPGPHTGVFYFAEEGPCRVTLDYTSDALRDVHKDLYMWLMQMVDPKNDFVICESFEFRKEDAKNREYIDYSTGEFVGVIKLFCQMTETRYIMQSASQAKGFWTDDKLKRVGLYVAGAEHRHVRDATRHWLHFDTFNMNNKYYLNKLK